MCMHCVYNSFHKCPVCDWDKCLKELNNNWIRHSKYMCDECLNFEKKK